MKKVHKNFVMQVDDKWKKDSIILTLSIIGMSNLCIWSTTCKVISSRKGLHFINNIVKITKWILEKVPLFTFWVTLKRLYKLYGHLLWIVLNCPKATQEDSLFLWLSYQKFLVLIWSTLERWKAESTLEPPRGLNTGPLN